MTAHLRPVIAQFQPITLAEMENVALLDRMETKYVLGISQLSAALQVLTRRYRVLDVQGVRLNHYQTIYFDTPDFTLYQQHTTASARGTRCALASMWNRISPSSRLSIRRIANAQ